MIAALLSIAISQLASPLPTQSATTPPTPASMMPAAATSSSPSTTSGETAMPVIDRLPRRMPYETPKMTTGDILIRNTGSTNTEGYTIVVHSDYSADVYDGPNPDHKTLAAPQAKWLFDIVKADSPIDQIAAGRCMKSASFGSRTFIMYDGVSSPDLSCGGGDNVRELNRTIGIVLNQLGVSPAAGRFRRRLL